MKDKISLKQAHEICIKLLEEQIKLGVLPKATLKEYKASIGWHQAWLDEWK